MKEEPEAIKGSVARLLESQLLSIGLSVGV